MSRRPRKPRPPIQKDLDVTFKSPEYQCLDYEMLFRLYYIPYIPLVSFLMSHEIEGHDNYYIISDEYSLQVDVRSRLAHGINLAFQFFDNNPYDPEESHQIGRNLQSFVETRAPTHDAPLRFITQLSTLVGYPISSRMKVGGANLIRLPDETHRKHAQRIIVSEAPYDREDWFRLMLYKGCKTMVSLSTDQDNSREKIRTLRSGARVDLHHLQEGEEMTIHHAYVPNIHENIIHENITDNQYDTVVIRNAKEEQPYPDRPDITVKHLEVHIPSIGYTYTLPHIVFKGWVDNQSTTHEDLIRIIELANARDAAPMPDLSKGTLPPLIHKKYSDFFPICINCVYGHGRSNTMALAYHIYHIMHEHIDNEMKKLTQPTLQQKIDTLQGMRERLNVNLQPMFNAIQLQVAYRAVVEENPQVKLLESFPEGILDHEIAKLRQLQQAEGMAGKHARRRGGKPTALGQ